MLVVTGDRHKAEVLDQLSQPYRKPLCDDPLNAP
jgi:hypothetical protein